MSIHQGGQIGDTSDLFRVSTNKGSVSVHKGSDSCSVYLEGDKEFSRSFEGRFCFIDSRQQPLLDGKGWEAVTYEVEEQDCRGIVDLILEKMGHEEVRFADTCPQWVRLRYLRALTPSPDFLRAQADDLKKQAETLLVRAGGLEQQASRRELEMRRESAEGDLVCAARELLGVGMSKDYIFNLVRDL